MPQPAVLLSALADEAAFHLSAVEQFSALAALGLEYYSLRNIDVGKGVKNVMKLSMAEIQKVRHLEDEYGLNVASIASPIGKVKLLDKADGTKNAYVPFKQYLAKDVARACELAHAFETSTTRTPSPRTTSSRRWTRSARSPRRVTAPTSPSAWRWRPTSWVAPASYSQRSTAG